MQDNLDKLDEAIKQARLHFNWPRDFYPLIAVDEFGNVENCHGKSQGVNEEEATYIADVISKL